MTTYNKLRNLVVENFDYVEEGNTLTLEYNSYKANIENYRGQVIMTTYYDGILDGIQPYFDAFEAYNEIFNLFYNEEI